MAVDYKQILPFESSFQLVRTNPKLTGNIKLTLDSNQDLWLNSIDANSELSKDQYKHYAIDPNMGHASQVKNFFTGGATEPNIIFDLQEKVDVLHSSSKYEDQFDFSDYFAGAKYLDSKYYGEKFSYFAPLYLGTQIPEYFVIFKIAGATNYPIGTSQANYPFDFKKYTFDMFDGSSVIGLYNLTSNSKIGGYLNRIINDPLLPKSPLQVNFQKDQLSYFRGVHVPTGTYSEIGENLYDFYRDAQPITGFEEYMTRGFERNSVLHPFILNMEFLFNDGDAELYDINRYVGFYCNFVELMQLNLDLDRYLDRNINTNTPGFRKEYSETEDTSIFQTNPNGVDILVTGQGVAGMDQYSADKLFFPYLQDRANDLYIIKRDSIVLDDIADKAQFKTTDKSLDLGKLFGPDVLFIQDVAVSVKLEGHSYYEVKFDQIINHLDRMRIYHIGGTRIDQNGLFDDVTATVNWSEIPNSGDIYSYYDYQNNLGDLYYFNPTGTVTKMVDTLTRSINSIRIKGFTAFAYGDRLFLKANDPGFNDGKFAVTLNYRTETFDNVTVFGRTSGAANLQGIQTYFEGGSSGNQMLLEVDHYDKIKANQAGLLVKTDKGWSRITAISKYASIITEANEQSDVLIAEALNKFDKYMSVHLEPGHTADVKYMTGNIKTLFKPRVGVLSFYNICDFDFDRESSDYTQISMIDLYKEYYIPAGRNLLNTDQVQYIVIGDGQIKIGDIVYDSVGTATTPISGIGDGLSYTVVQGDCFVIEKSKVTSFPYIDSITDPNNPTPVAGGPVSAPLTQSLYDQNEEQINFTGFSTIKSDSAVISDNTSDLFKYRDKYINGILASEYDFANENDTTLYATKSKIIPFISKWGLLNGKDVRDNAYRLNTDIAFGPNNFAPDHFTKVANTPGFTHEWFYVESNFNYMADNKSILENKYYFDQPLNLSETDKENSILFNELGFNDYFIYTPTANSIEIGPSQFRYSLIDKDDRKTVDKTFFKGTPFIFREIAHLANNAVNGKPGFVENSTRFDGYKFSTLLKVKKEDFLGEDPITYKFIEHRTFKWITFVIEIKLSSIDQIAAAQKSIDGSGLVPDPGFDDIFGDYRIAFDGNGVSNIDLAFLYYAINKKYNNVLDSFSTITLGNKLDFSNAGITNLPTSFSIDRTNKDYFIDLKDEIALQTKKAFIVDSFDDFYLYLKGAPGNFILKKIVSDGTPIIIDVQLDKIFVDNISNLVLEGQGPSTGTEYSIPSASANYWELFNFNQFKGGKLYYENLFRYLSFSYVKDIINKMSSNIEYITYDLFEENVIKTTNEIYVEITDPEIIEKDQVITSEPDILDLAISTTVTDLSNKQSPSFPKQVGFNLFANDLTSPYSINRYSGDYDAIFKTLTCFDSKISLLGDTVEINFANNVINTAFADNFKIDNFKHIKVSKTPILTLANDPKYQSVYPLIGETAIGSQNYFLLSANWEYGFHFGYSDKISPSPVAGTLRIGEDSCFVTKLINMPPTIELENYQAVEIDINSLNGNYSIYELIFQEDQTTVNGVINLTNVFTRYVAGTVLSDNIKATFVDVNGDPIITDPNVLGDIDIDTYINQYIQANLIGLYKIDSVEVWTKPLRNVTSSQSGQQGVNPNTVQFVNLSDLQRAQQGFAQNKNVGINKLDDFSLKFNFQKAVDSSIQVSLKVKIKLI